MNHGLVVVQVLIDTQGRTRDPQVIKCDPIGLGFEEAALRAVAKWQYEPLMMNGEAKSVYYTVTVEFRRRPEA